MPQIILIEKSTVIPATPARLFKSLTDAKQLSRWLADRVESDPRQGGKIVINYNGHEKRGEYRRLVQGAEVGIRWTAFEELVPIDITGFKIDKVAKGTRVRVVDLALPEDAGDLQALWTQRLKRLKNLYHYLAAAPQRSATKKKATPKRQAAKTAPTLKRRPVAKKAKKK
jgi:uncharacterized protein YndB with AHSA1/START domain